MATKRGVDEEESLCEQVATLHLDQEQHCEESPEVTAQQDEGDNEKNSQEDDVHPESAAQETRRKPNTCSYASYIYKVLKQVHPDMGISQKAMVIMDSFMHDIFERLASEAG